MGDIFILVGSGIFIYLFIYLPIIKIYNIIDNKNRPNGAGISNSIVFDIKHKRSEAQQIPTTD